MIIITRSQYEAMKTVARLWSYPNPPLEIRVKDEMSELVTMLKPHFNDDVQDVALVPLVGELDY